jgi:SPP1 family predicted phage head-tail adaptor
MKGTRAGKYRHSITFQRNAAKGQNIRDSLGQPAETWVDVISVYALVEPLSSDEKLTAQQLLPDVTHRISCPWFSTPIHGDYRVLFGTRVLNLFPPTNTEEHNVEIIVMAVEPNP